MAKTEKKKKAPSAEPLHPWQTPTKSKAKPLTEKEIEEHNKSVLEGEHRQCKAD